MFRLSRCVAISSLLAVWSSGPIAPVTAAAPRFQDVKQPDKAELCAPPPLAPGPVTGKVRATSVSLVWEANPFGCQDSFWIEVGSVPGGDDLGRFEVPGTTRHLLLTAP